MKTLIKDNIGLTATSVKGIRQEGKRIIWGAHPEAINLPIVNLPPDTIKVRRRVRNNDCARAFVKTPKGILHYILAPCEGGLELTLMQGANGK